MIASLSREPFSFFQWNALRGETGKRRKDQDTCYGNDKHDEHGSKPFRQGIIFFHVVTSLSPKKPYSYNNTFQKPECCCSKQQHRIDGQGRSKTVGHKSTAYCQS